MIHDAEALDSGKVPRLLAWEIGLAGATLFAAVSLVRRQLDWRALRTPVVGSYAGYALSVWASLFFAQNVSAGLIDASRTSAALLLLGLLAVCFRSMENWGQWVAKSGVVAAWLCGAVGAFQVVAVSGLQMPLRQEMERVHGLMGNVNLYAGYLLLLFPLCLLGCAILRGGWRAASFISVMLLGTLLVFLQCRSVWLGALVCSGVFLAAVLIRPGIFGLPRWGRSAAAAIAVLAMAFGALFFFLAPRDHPLADRAREVFTSGNHVSDGGRTMVWRGTIRIIADHFPFGVGAGNFPLRLHETRGGGEIDFSRIRREWNQPHNDFLWVFAEKGLAGILTFLSIFFFAALAGVHALRRAPRPGVAWTAVAGLAGLAAYAVDSIFSFPLDRVNHQAALAVILATLCGCKTPAAMAASSPQDSSAVWFRIWLLAATPLLAAGLIICFASWRQERHIALARAAMEKKDWPAMLVQAQRAATPLRTLDSFMVPVSFLQGFAFAKMGRTESAIEKLRQAQRENPYRDYILNNLANLLLLRGDLDAAAALYRRAVELYPESAESHLNLANCLRRQGLHREAAEIISRSPRPLNGP